MKRRFCTGLNPKGTGPCQSSAGVGFDTCSRCGGRRKPRASTRLPRTEAELAEYGEHVPVGLRKPRAAKVAIPGCDPELADHIAETDRLLDEAEAAVLALPIESTGGAEPNHPKNLETSRLVLNERGVELHHATWRQLAERTRELGGVDAVVCDPPYSSRTHQGHDDGTNGANDAARERPDINNNATRYALGLSMARRTLDYAPWAAADVVAFVAAWAPLTRGWFVALTDHVLVPAWEAALESHGLYVFSPLACVEPGSRFRATGDGHSQWSCQAMIARPRSGAWLTEWRAKRRAAGGACALDGAYIVGSGTGDARSGRRDGSRIPGGKPLALVRALVRDHSFAGDLVCDPTCGGGTTGEACIAEGRRALLGDMDAAHVEIARKRILSCPGEQRRLTLDVDAKPMTQASLLETGS